MKQTIKTLGIALFASVAGAGVYARFFQPEAPSFTIGANTNQNDEYHLAGNRLTGSAAMAGSEDFINASAVATPSVVFIKTVSAQAQSSMFDWFFGGGGGTSRQVGSGSGVIFSADGYVVTNNHVIDRAENIEVIHEKRSYQAVVVGVDPNTDLAVLKIEGKSLPAIRIADSRKVQVGEWVLAVGNPFNLNSTVTAGIVSAKGRNLNIVNSQFPIESFIQTDAAINPGNSGGALVNIKGELIGINTAIYSQTGSYAGYGFAVPSDIVAKIVSDLIKHGEPQKAFFGADVSDISAQVAEKLNTSDLDGVAVTNLSPDGAAEKAGLKKGDIILKINETVINSRANFDEELSYRYPGDKLKVTYKRNNKSYHAELELTNKEGTTSILKREIYSSTTLGGQLEAISKVERDKYGISSGVRIVKMNANGFLARLNISPDFIITSVNYRAVKSPQDLEDLISQAKNRLLIEGVNKNGQRYTYYF